MKLLAIDGNSLVNRAFYGVRLLTNKNGEFTNAVYGFVNMLLKLLEDENPELACVCFDMRDKTFRHLHYDGYKAQRKGMPEELAEQMPVIKKVLDLMGISRMELSGFEADDLLGTLAKKCTQAGDSCVIVTGDRDSLQFIAQGAVVKLVITKAGQTTYKDYSTAEFAEEYGGLTPDKIIDLKALAGDKSDNIPGVAGIGDKTAMNLICEFGSLDGVYQNLGSEKITKSVNNKLTIDEENARLSYYLATGNVDVPIEKAPRDFAICERDNTGLFDEFQRLDFGSLIKRLNLSKGSNSAVAATKREISCQSQRINSGEEFAQILEKCRTEKIISCVLAPDLNAGAILAGENCYTFSEFDLKNGEYMKLLSELFSGEIKIAMHNVKPTIVALLAQNIEPRGIVFDTALSSYLLSPTDSEYSIETCAKKLLDADILPEKSYADSDAFSLLSGSKECADALAQHAHVTVELYVETSALLDRDGMKELMDTIEMPLVNVLAHMESVGFCVDKKRLLDFGVEISEKLRVLTDEIYELADEQFNVNSTKMLGVVLFEKLGLPAKKKTKTGYSTDIEVLENLRGAHPIIEKIIEYRKLSKLNSTYVDGLIKVIAPDGRIHSTFQQMVTATGRLSSTDPNLQNLPIRREEGAEIRRSFVARQGCVLVDADYSQIELRILAHISDDKIMQEAFASGEDIHSVTASQVFDVPLEFVTPQMRSRAKAVNFGIVYGISAFSLADDSKVSNKEAAQYIDNYLKKYSGVHNYMVQIKEQAKRDGFVSTLFGRRRYLPEIKSSNFNVRSFGERVALNTPIQGTAADIMKIAMINVFNRLNSENLSAKLLLQIHDELIVECPIDEIERVKLCVEQEMQNAAQLSVKLRADVSSADNWYDAKK